MNKNYPENIDPRPRRRRDKDNPYRLFTVGIDTDSPHFYVEFTDPQGIKICTKVGRSVWELLDRFELDDKKYMNEVERHHDENHDAFFYCPEMMTLRKLSGGRLSMKCFIARLMNSPKNSGDGLLCTIFTVLHMSRSQKLRGARKWR